MVGVMCQNCGTCYVRKREHMNTSVKDILLGLDRPVPRYTSYPTAPNFKEGISSEEYLQWVYLLPAQAELSLYLHVPFCSKMCWYCGCHTKITQRYAPVEDYVHLMLREIVMVGQILTSSQRVKHIHFGGGSPSMLLPADFKKIMDTIKSAFTLADDAEIAMEIDPRGVTEDHIRTYVACGLNRASLGVQDFDQTVLESVNRPQPFELSQQVVAWLRQHGVHHINFDFLYGLPHQTVTTMIKTMEQALSLDPSRISLFGYAHVPWMKKHMQLMPTESLPDKSLRYDLFDVAARILGDNGYTIIGIDHFAKKDDAICDALHNKTLRRNFQGYTTDTSDALIGVGSSAIGSFPQGFVQNSPHAPIYREKILSTQLPVTKFCTINEEDKLRGAVIEQLMCYLTVDVPAICRAYGFEENYLDECVQSLTPWGRDGLLTIAGGVVTVNPAARHLVRLTAAAFDSYLPKVAETPRHAMAV